MQTCSEESLGLLGVLSQDLKTALKILEQRVGGIGEIDHRQAPFVPSLDGDVATITQLFRPAS